MNDAWKDERREKREGGGGGSKLVIGLVTGKKRRTGG